MAVNFTSRSKDLRADWQPMFHDLNVPWPAREGSVTSKKAKKAVQKTDENTHSNSDTVDPLAVLTESEKSRLSQLVYELRERTLSFPAHHKQLGIPQSL